jgi:hypothetical protein
MRRLVVVLVLIFAAAVWGATQALGQPAPAAPATDAGSLRADFNHDGFADLAVGAPNEAVGSLFGAGAVNVLYGSADGVTGTGSDFFTQNTSGVINSAESQDDFGGALAAGDFDHDGFSDLAVSVAGEEVGSVIEAGAVNVLYGSAGGLTGAGSQYFTQDTSGVGGSAEEFDHFGGALTAGDFNRDGFADLAVGTPDEDVGGPFAAGAVNVLYGSAGGLTGTSSQYFTQDSPGVGSSPEQSDQFGFALTAGDFNHDGSADLAVGVVGEDADVPLTTSAGAVNILYGAAGGLSGTGSQLLSQDSPGVGSSPEEGDHFGGALTAGDFDHDGFADLVVGVPEEDVNFILDAGAVNVLYGSAAGLTGSGSQYFTQDTPGVPSSIAISDRLGAALAAGDFDHDGFADLAMGAPTDNVGSIDRAGLIIVLYGSVDGLTRAGSQLFTQDTPGVGSDAERFDFFGAALAAADFDHDGLADLAVGAPSEDVGRIDRAGTVNVLFGSAAKLTGAGSQRLTQNTQGVDSAAERFDSFGAALAAAGP